MKNLNVTMCIMHSMRIYKFMRILRVLRGFFIIQISYEYVKIYNK